MKERLFWKRSRNLYRILIIICVLAIIISIGLVFYYSEVQPETTPISPESPSVSNEDDPDRIENGIHVRTGLVEAKGLMTVVHNCTNCHSAQLVMQNRMDKERWISTIRWMQKTQNLWDLGANEDIIVNYLVTNYPPIKKGRREALQNIEWYDVKY